MKKILVTGASGFIGYNLCKYLSKSGLEVFGAVRSINSFLLKDFKYISVGNIDINTNWKNILIDTDYIIHCAGPVHKMANKKDYNFYYSTNVEGTKNLAEQAVKAGVKRLVFLSTIKVNGESTDKINDTKIFNNNSFPKPQNNYEISKLEAEKVLWEISSRTGLEVVVVRLPLVYGNGVKGNLERLIKLVKSRIPLPLSLVENQRSMLGIDNLIDLLICCIDHSEVSGKTFLASDGEDLSTPELIKLIASSMGKKANLFPFPISMLKFLASVLGKREEINRLVGSLRIDNSYTKQILNWTPPVSVEEGIRRMVQEK